MTSVSKCAGETLNNSDGGEIRDGCCKYHANKPKDSVISQHPSFVGESDDVLLPRNFSASYQCSKSALHQSCLGCRKKYNAGVANVEIIVGDGVFPCNMIVTRNGDKSVCN
jgi:hypothetical protein